MNALLVINAASTDQTGDSTHPGKPGWDLSYSNSAAFKAEQQQHNELGRRLLCLQGSSTGAAARVLLMPTLMVAWARNLGRI